MILTAVLSVHLLCPEPKLIGTRDERWARKGIEFCANIDRKPCAERIEKRGDKITVICVKSKRYEDLNR